MYVHILLLLTVDNCTAEMRCIWGLDWQSFIFITLVICSYCELPKQGKAELDGCVLCDGWLHVELEGGGWMEGTKDK